MYNNFKNLFFLKGWCIMEEDSTNYGEFISSYFAWLTLDKQKEIVDKLENSTKK